MSVNTGANVNVELILDPNDKYMYRNPDAKILVKNIAEAVVYRKEPPQSRAMDSMTFKFDTEGFFIDRSAFLTIDKLPIRFTFPPTDAGGGVADAITFHNKVFNNYKNLTLKPFGLLNAISTIEVTVDGGGGRLLTTNVSDILPIISNYYNPEDVHQFFDASQMDYTWSNNIHTTANLHNIPSISTTGSKILIRNADSELDINNPFSAVVNNKFNSRTPLLSYDGPNIAAGSTTGSFWLHNLTTWLPFNLLGIAGDDTPLYNANSLSIKLTFHANWASRLFSSSYNSGTGESDYKATIDTSNSTYSSLSDASMALRLYRAPQNIVSNMKLDNPYIFEYPIVECDSRWTDVKFGAGVDSTRVNSAPFDLRAIPKQMYLAVVPKCDTDNDYLSNNNHFCRIDSLSTELCGTNTVIAPNNSSEMIYQYCKEEGLNKNKNTALYLSGFPVVVDVSNMIGCTTNSFIGVNPNDSVGKYTFRTDMNVTRLHQDSDFSVSPATDASLWTKREKLYQLKCIFVYQGFFCYNLLGQKFSTIESLSSSSLNSISNNINDLYRQFVPKANVLGGSILSAIGPALKSVGKGLFNVVKAAIINKDGFRDRLVDQFTGSGAISSHSNIIGGFDGHTPLIGGRSGDSWRAY